MIMSLELLSVKKNIYKNYSILVMYYYGKAIMKWDYKILVIMVSIWKEFNLIKLFYLIFFGYVSEDEYIWNIFGYIKMFVCVIIV